MEKLSRPDKQRALTIGALFLAEVPVLRDIP